MTGHIFWLVAAAVTGSCCGIIQAHIVHARRVRARQAARRAERPRK